MAYNSRSCQILEVKILFIILKLSNKPFKLTVQGSTIVFMYFIYPKKRASGYTVIYCKFYY